MEHIFENSEVGVQFTGQNLVEVSDFLSGTHFEFTGNSFVLPSPSGDLVVGLNEWIVRRENGTFYTIPVEEELVPVHHINEFKTVLTKKKRGGKKK